MPIYAEAIFWYLILVDALIYNVLVYSKGKWHKKTAHWVSPWFPFNKFVGLLYLVLVLWVGFALLRLQIILFK
jgi:hypothetical protein